MLAVRVDADNVRLFRIAHLQINSAINLWLHIGLRLVLCSVRLKMFNHTGEGVGYILVSRLSQLQFVRAISRVLLLKKMSQLFLNM